MESFAWHNIVGMAVAHKGKPAVYVSNGLEYDKPEDDEIWKFVMDQCKIIFGETTDEFYSTMTHMIGGGLFFFDTKEEQYAFYRIFEQPLTDSSAIYACTYDASGVCQTENT